MDRTHEIGLGDEGIQHQFKLAGMRKGFWFFGCPRCWFQLEPFAAAYPECPECLHKLQVFNVTEEDMPVHCSEGV